MMTCWLVETDGLEELDDGGKKKGRTVTVTGGDDDVSDEEVTV